MGGSSAPVSVRTVGRYALYGVIASGGMATVHLGRLLGPVGFARTVAIKRLHAHLAQDPEFVSMFLDEARLAARIRHPNVVPTLDVVALEGEIFLVMEYVQGDSLARLLRSLRDRQELVPLPVALSIVTGVLHGLHAAHEATNERGEPLGLVHRDVSPHNVLVGTDGVARVLDFGVAKAVGRIQTTRDGKIKGKLAYMSPEQINGKVTRSTDVYATSVLLWETLTGRRLFLADSEGAVLKKVLDGIVEPPSKYVPGLPAELDAIILRGLAEDAKRFQTAREMARALERVGPPAPASDVGEWVEAAAGKALAERADRVAEIESCTEMSPSGVSPDQIAMAAVAVAARRQPRSPGTEVEVTMPMPSPARSTSDVPTQLATASAVRPEPVADARKPRRGRTMAVVGSSAVVLAAVGFLVFGRIGRAPTPSLSAAATTRAVDTSAPASEPAVASAPLAAPAPIQSEVGVVPASATSHPATTRPRAGSPRNPAPVALPATNTHRADCDPPYVVDSTGDKHYKRECLN